MSLKKDPSEQRQFGSLGYNVTFSHLPVINAERVLSLRTYISTSKTYYSMGEPIDMGKLRDEGKAIAERSADEDKQRNASSNGFGGVIIRV